MNVNIMLAQQLLRLSLQLVHHIILPFAHYLNQTLCCHQIIHLQRHIDIHQRSMMAMPQTATRNSDIIHSWSPTPPIHTELCHFLILVQVLPIHEIIVVTAQQIEPCLGNQCRYSDSTYWIAPRNSIHSFGFSNRPKIATSQSGQGNNGCPDIGPMMVSICN